MTNYRLSLDAEADVRRLYRHGIDQFGRRQADRYFDGLFDRFGQIAEQPLVYQRVDDIRPGYRRSIYGGHVIYFRTGDAGVEIMRVIGREDMRSS